GIMTLSIPVEKPATIKALTRDIQISRHDKWEHLHWTAITSAYNSSPFFEYYSDEFRPFFLHSAKYKYLFDFNQALQETICPLLGINHHIKYSEEYMTASDNCHDLRQAIHPKRPSIEPNTLIPYYQVFTTRNGFTPDLSIIDLLFNMGPESILLLQKEPVKI
ncbi:MAG: WbqC family protein, partial [Bacteroidales bacterium]